MKEAGIDISNQTTDIIDPNILNNADFVVTLCGVQQINWGFDDPAKAHGTEDVFPIRAEISDRLLKLGNKCAVQQVSAS